MKCLAVKTLVGALSWLQEFKELNEEQKMANVNVANGEAALGLTGGEVDQVNLEEVMGRYRYDDEVKNIIKSENLLPQGVVNRLQRAYSQYSTFNEKKDFLFTGKGSYVGLGGFREMCEILAGHGIQLSAIKEREFYIEVYRFMATRHSLNSINWDNYETDSIFQLVVPQPGMTEPEATKAYVAADSDEKRAAILEAYMEKTNPHDGKQQLNKPGFENDGEIDFLEGSQHKYPQCMLIFDKTTQNCFSFCTYCFRHAQVRGDEDMFLQNDVSQIHSYLKLHPEVTDILITGGDGGFLPAARLKEYMMPIIEDPTLGHVRTVRIGSRALTFHPQMILRPEYEETLALFRLLYDNGIQVAWMSHFSTPREIVNPSTVAAIRRLKANGVMVRSQSPIMNHISLFKDENDKVDVERSAQNWIDLANIIASLGVGFHSMYCARPTGEHHYFAAPLADIEQVFSKIYNSLASLNRPSRHISMTISAGKLAILGTTYVNGDKCFALQFTESRNMAWMDRVFLAKHDETTNKIDLIAPYNTEKFFFEDELTEIELQLETKLQERLN